jgi:hypothetical protein
MIGDYRIHGYAIVSDDHRLASASRERPPEFRSPAWREHFQAARDEAAVTVISQPFYMARANPTGRIHLVASNAVEGIEQRDGAWWWNSRAIPVEAALRRAAPVGGIAVIVGGRRVFDMFLGLGFDEFHLGRAKGVRLPNGYSVFSTVRLGLSPEDIMARQAMTAGPAEEIDPERGVSLTVWRRNAWAA